MSVTRQQEVEQIYDVVSACEDSLCGARRLLKHAVDDGVLPEELEAVLLQGELQEVQGHRRQGLLLLRGAGRHL